ncbi:hypothetical protein [Umezawaea sp. NPDC059074]|uniref:hypothetical protein n=1 Tax=Umezawaea sp. NPDC059074 TaxID=3346716 RepID=UPI00369167E6
MRKNRIVAGLVGVGAVLALAVGSATVAIGSSSGEQVQRQASAPAKASQGSVELAAGRGVKDFGEDGWYMHGTAFEFSVKAGAANDGKSDAATVFVSWPESMDLVSSAGESWVCATVAGGVECTNSTAVEPGGFWPDLTLTARANTMMQDTIDAYLRGVGSVESHVGVPFTFDTN